MTQKMKAVSLTGFGGAEVLSLGEVAVPEPAAGEVLIEVRACGINPIDWKTRAGTGVGARWQGEALPAIIGWDIAGIVRQSNAAAFKPGDEVYTMARFPMPGGGYAQYAVVPAGEIASKPTSLNFKQAAAVPLAALTAWQALIEKAGLKAGQRVLVHAAAGGVGHFAVQIAKAQGAHVIGTASARNRDFVLGLGADQVIDYTKKAFEREIKDVDVVFHTIGGDAMANSWQVVKPGGTLVSITAPVSDEDAAQHKATGIRVTVKPSGEQLAVLAGLIDQGAVKPHIDKVFPLDGVAQSHDYVEKGHTRGKVVIEI